MFQLIPIGQSQIDWDVYLRLVTDTTGRSPTAKLDEQWIKVKRSLSDFLATLKEIECPGSESNTPAGSILEHLHFSFIFVAPRLTTFSVITKSRLMATTVETVHDDFGLTILSGNLSQWRSAILNCCVDTVSQDVRRFGAAAIEYFDRAGLRQFMIGLTLIPMGDGTIRILEKQ